MTWSASLVLTMTDKRENAWTTTTKFKTELMELAAGRTVIELGAHVGYSTEMLANVSKLVFACEMSEEVLKQNMERTAALSNVVYFQFHSVFDDWTKGFPRNKIDLAFLDAAHDKASVLQDLERLHKLGIPVVALDDYGAEKGVKLAVHEFVDAQKAVVRSYIGEAPPWHFADRTIHEHEGIVLDMLDAGFNAGALDKQPIGRWAAYPQGVFLTGDFSPVARIDLRADGTGAYEESNATMFRKLFWRKWLPLEEEAHGSAGFVIAVDDGPRFDVQFNALQNGGIAHAGDGGRTVLIRAEFIRALGESILSALF